MFIQFIRVNITPFMCIDHILPFTTFISRNKQIKTFCLAEALLAEAEVQKVS